MGAEDGGVTIFGIESPSAWRFRVALSSDHFLDDEDAGILKGSRLPNDIVEPLQHAFDSLAEALASLAYAWNRLYPLQIDPEFKQTVLQLKSSLDMLGAPARCLQEHWHTLCA